MIKGNYNIPDDLFNALEDGHIDEVVEQIKNEQLNMNRQEICELVRLVHDQVQLAAKYEEKLEDLHGEVEDAMSALSDAEDAASNAQSEAENARSALENLDWSID